MTKTTKEEIIVRTVYVTNDGKEFNARASAQLHEWRLTATKVYMLYRLAGTPANSELYSSRELAEQSIIGTSLEDYFISELYVNEMIALQAISREKEIPNV